MLWSEKYKPQKLEDILGHSEAVKRLGEWAKEWSKGKQQKAVILHGLTGAGKTAIANALANEFDFDFFEMNASDIRNAKMIDKLVGLAAVSKSLFGKTRLILLDEIDGLSGNQDRGGASAIARIVKEPKCPILLTANDIWEPKLRGIMFECERIELKKVNYLSIANHLEKILKKEKIRADKEVLKRIAENCGGDIRSAINDLQQISEGREEITEKDAEILFKRDREENMFEITKVILKTLDFGTARGILDSTTEEPGFILNWVDENLPKEYKHPQDLYNAYEKLSRADIYLGRVSNRQHWGFVKYALDMMSAGVSLSKSEKYSGFVPYGFPSVIKYLSSSKPEREMRKGIARKIAKLVHTSTRTAVQDYLPMYYELVKDKALASRIAAQFDLTEEELEFLGAKKTKEILDKAEKIKEEHFRERIK
jgi:replication factor C large subunit